MSDTSVPDNALAVQWVFGAIIVLMYAWDRFRKPVPTRPTTTFWRYWSAGCGYAVAMLALFVLLGGGFVSFDLRALAPLISGIPDDVGVLPGPLLSALVLTSLLPHVPLLARIDESIKQWFWEVGNIPAEVRLLGSQMAGARYHYRLQDHAHHDALTAFDRFGADPKWLTEAEGSLKHSWACCIALLVQIQQWRGERGFARFLDRHTEQLDQLLKRFDSLSWLSERAFKQLDGTSDPETALPKRRIVDADIMALWHDLCVYAAGGVLNETWNDKQRRAALIRLGFSGLPMEASRVSAHDIVLVMGLVFIAMLFVPLAIKRFFLPDMLPLQWRVLITVPIVYAIAIVAAIYPKSAWSFACRAAGGPRPYAAYAVSGLIAVVAAFIVGVLFRFAFESPGNVVQTLSKPGAFANAWWTSVERWPWLLMTLFATVSIAWAADDYHPGGVVPRWLRWAEAVLLAAVFGAVQWMVVDLLMVGATEDRQAQLAEALPRMLVTSSVIGAGIGALVPALHRAKGMRRRVPHTPVQPQPA